MSAPVAYVEVNDVESFQIDISRLTEAPRATYLKVTSYRSLVLEIYVSTTHVVLYVHRSINSFTQPIHPCTRCCTYCRDSSAPGDGDFLAALCARPRMMSFHVPPYLDVVDRPARWRQSFFVAGRLKQRLFEHVVLCTDDKKEWRVPDTGILRVHFVEEPNVDRTLGEVWVFLFYFVVDTRSPKIGSGCTNMFTQTQE